MHEAVFSDLRHSADNKHIEVDTQQRLMLQTAVLKMDTAVAAVCNAVRSQRTQSLAAFSGRLKGFPHEDMVCNPAATFVLV